MDEIWKKIEGYDGYYSVSNVGRVMITGQRKWGSKIGTVMKPFDNNGYVRYTLVSVDERRHKLAHILVYEAFVGKIPNGMEINHKDGNKKNNSIDNLETVTASNNALHSYKKLGKKASAHRSRFSWDQAEAIRKEYSSGNTTYEKIADQHGVTMMTIFRIVSRITYNDPDLKNRPI